MVATNVQKGDPRKSLPRRRAPVGTLPAAGSVGAPLHTTNRPDTLP
ncbi:MAG: hypothetical protein ACYC3I_06385 [Gemmataceae bacterium]